MTSYDHNPERIIDKQCYSSQASPPTLSQFTASNYLHNQMRQSESDEV